jgi:hypothetical protein
LNWTLVSNLQYLDDYSARTPEDLNPVAFTAIMAAVTNEPGITLTRLRNAVDKRYSDDINWMLLTERLYVDLERERLDDPGKVQVFPDSETSQIAQIVRRDLADPVPSHPRDVLIKVVLHADRGQRHGR